MKVDTKDLISVSEASSRGVSRLVADASAGRPQIVLRNNKAVAAVVDVQTIEKLQRLEELEDDLRLLSIALARTITDSGRLYSLDEAAVQLGIDPDSLNESEEG